MGTKYALKNVRIKDSKIPKISMCSGGCGQGYYYEPPSCGGGCGLGLADSLKYLYNKTMWIKKKKK